MLRSLVGSEMCIRDRYKIYHIQFLFRSSSNQHESLSSLQTTVCTCEYKSKPIQSVCKSVICFSNSRTSIISNNEKDSANKVFTGGGNEYDVNKTCESLESFSHETKVTNTIPECVDAVEPDHDINIEKAQHCLAEVETPFSSSLSIDSGSRKEDDLTPEGNYSQPHSLLTRFLYNLFLILIYFVFGSRNAF